MRKMILTVALAALMQSAIGAQFLKPVAASKAARTPEFIVAPAAMSVDLLAVLEAGVGGTLDVTLPDGSTARLLLERLERHDNGDITWRAHVFDANRGDLVAMGTTGAAGTYGEIQTGAGAWGIIPSQAGHDWVFDKALAESRMPPAAYRDDAMIPPALPVAPRAKAICPAVAAMPAPVVTIDVLAVLAPDFVSTHGGAAGAETRLNSIFANMNAYFTASNVAIQYRRVGTMTASFQAASTANDDDSVALNAITAGSGSFANVAAIRNYFGADMVAFFRGPKSVSGNSISGVAWKNGDRNGGIAGADTHMYSVSGDWTFPGATLPAHELGHNLGNAHDRPNDSPVGGSTTYSNGHYFCGGGASGCGTAGFPDMGTGFGTIMAYPVPTVAKFSSPSLTCQSTRAGSVASACGVADAQDDVRSMNCIRQAVAGFRNSWVGSCDLTIDTDRDGIPDCLEAGNGKSTGAKDNDIFNNNLLFAAQQYRDFLSREPDADGLNFWTSGLAGGTQTRLGMADGYFNSPEFQGTAAPIARLYFAYFLRIPDYGGLTHWIGQFKAGSTLQQVSQSFAQSPEFVQRYGALNNTQFISLVYSNVLGRAPDTAGLNFWVGQLATNATDRGGMMAQFSESPEYLALIRNKVYVTMMYTAMLRRAPDQAGFDFWVGNLNAGQTGQGLVGGFLGSLEYHNRFLP